MSSTTKRRKRGGLPPAAPHSPPSPSGFAAALSKVAVAQICASVGYSCAEPFALRALSDIAGRYIDALGRSAASVAAAHGRTDSNVLDLARAIEDLGDGRGFVGNADPTGMPLRSAALKELMAFVESVDEIPFPNPIRRDGEQKAEREQWRSFSAAGREQPFRHVPSWTPCFPEGPWWREDKEKARFEEESIRAAEADGNAGNEEIKLMEVPAKRERVRFGLSVAKKRRVGHAVIWSEQEGN